MIRLDSGMGITLYHGSGAHAAVSLRRLLCWHTLFSITKVATYHHLIKSLDVTWRSLRVTSTGRVTHVSQGLEQWCRVLVWQDNGIPTANDIYFHWSKTHPHSHLTLTPTHRCHPIDETNHWPRASEETIAPFHYSIKNVQPPNFAKQRSHEMWVWNNPIAFKFDRCFGSNNAKAPVKNKTNMIVLTHNLIA